MEKAKIFKFLPEKLLVFVLSSASILAVIYRFYRLDWFTIIVAVASSLIIVFILSYFNGFFNEPGGEKKEKKTSRGYGLIAVVAGFSVAILLSVLAAYGSTKAMFTPWEVLPSWIFAFYFALMLLMFYISKLVSGSITWFFGAVSFLVIPLVYKLGYGYDFFIHEASLRQIDLFGFITPKTDYYIGQYALLLMAHKLLRVSYTLLHLWLVPFSALILIPWSINRSGGDWMKKLGWLLLFILPYSFLTFTTPQNLGMLLLLAEVVILTKPSRTNLTVSAFLVLFNLTIHPISAIPGLGLLVLTIMSQKRFARFTLAIGSLLPLTIPALLLLSGSAYPGSHSSYLKLLLPKNILTLPSYENFGLNSPYAYYFNLPVIAILLFAAGFILMRKKIKSLSANLGLAIGLLMATAALHFVKIKGVIDYEQADYGRRLLLVAVILMLPFMAEFLHDFVTRLMSKDKVVVSAWLVFASALLTASFYLSYPRHDNYFNSRGLSVGQADIDAVNYIENDANSEPYIVLSNQQVSAASLSQFGFAHYYKDAFYYPIPTTNPLYGYYLDMVYKKPSRTTMSEAAGFAGVKVGYFVLNKYWNNFPILMEEAKLNADSFETTGNGQDYIFKYRFD